MNKPRTLFSGFLIYIPSAVFGPPFFTAPPPCDASCVTVGLVHTGLFCFPMISEVMLAFVQLVRRVGVVEVVFFLESHVAGFQLLVGFLWTEEG